MNIIILGAAGFIGTNLIFELIKNKNNVITAVDKNKAYFSAFENATCSNLKIIESDLSINTDFEMLLSGQDIVYHLLSTTVPTNSNQHIVEELESNVILSSKIFEACVYREIKKVIFISSGGTVYGKEEKCPLNEKTATNPISSYGVQKVTIEKLLYLYNHMYGLDYRIVRLANPYGPYQRPNGLLGAVTTFTYKALKCEEIQVYGDGSVVRDFIFIDDAVRGIEIIANGNSHHHTFNLGSGYGTSINEVLATISNTLGINIQIKYLPGRTVDVPINYLDISRFEKAYGKLNPISLKDGIMKTASFMKEYYKI